MDLQQIANGQILPETAQGDYNKIAFLVQQALADMQTATLVQVVACTNDGGLAPFGFVDVVPMVNQIDGQGNGTPHTTIYGIPYCRIQGGSSAIILDPVVGDIGMCVFATRDLTKVKNTQAQANPGSFRTFSFSDGMYLGGMLNGTPTQYIRFGADGISIVSPVAVNIVGPLNQSGGAVSYNDDIIANGISLTNHVHSGVQSGSSDTGPPV